MFCKDFFLSFFVKMNDNTKLEKGFLVNNFSVVKHIGSGGYGDIYLVTNSKTENGEIYAMKTEKIDAAKKGLLAEIDIIEKLQGAYYFPKIIANGQTDRFYYCVMELLGPSLSKMRRSLPKHRFTTFSILRLSSEMLKCIQTFHNCGYVHRDIKPANFLIRPNRDHPICLIDFGLSAPYIDFKTNTHLPMKEKIGFVGTYRYCSINAHKKNLLSRRDDLISWFYCIVELARGAVPWPGSKNQELAEKMKTEYSPNEFLDFLPQEFAEIYIRIMELGYEEVPPYERILHLLDQAINRLCPMPRYFDWEKLKREQLSEISEISLKMRPPTRRGRSATTYERSSAKRKSIQKSEDACYIA